MRTGGDHSRGSDVYVLTPWKRTFFSGGLVTAGSAPSVCQLWRWLSGAWVQSGAVHQVFCLWCLPDDAGQGQLLPVPCPGPPGMNYKVICRWLLLVLGLEVLRRGQAVNQGQLQLVLGLGLLSNRYRAHKGQMLIVCDLRTFERF